MMKPEPPMGLLLRLAHTRASKSFAAALRPFGIDGRHFGVLFSIGRGGPMSQRHLIDAIDSDKSSMVRIIDELEGRELVLRRPAEGDRRAYAVELTDSGRAMLATASELADQMAEQLLSCFDEQEQSTFKTLLARFVAAGPPGGRPEESPSR
jgi:MarR family transcriptional regulator, lower aerobic nicotinate degradation pathway regulator